MKTFITLKLILTLGILAIFVLFYSCSCKHISKVQEVEKVWYEKLPACPCENPDWNGIKLNDGWAKDVGDLKKYHNGAMESFRSYPAVSTNVGESCQQCCYDSLGKLIKAGSGAGTPDKVSACDGEDSRGVMKFKYLSLLSHYYKDVKPWEDYGGADSGWKKYNLLWVPNQGNGCH